MWCRNTTFERTTKRNEHPASASHESRGRERTQKVPDTEATCEGKSDCLRRGQNCLLIRFYVFFDFHTLGPLAGGWNLFVWYWSVVRTALLLLPNFRSFNDVDVLQHCDGGSLLQPCRRLELERHGLVVGSAQRGHLGSERRDRRGKFHHHQIQRALRCK